MTLVNSKEGNSIFYQTTWVVIEKDERRRLKTIWFDTECQTSYQGCESHGMIQVSHKKYLAIFNIHWEWIYVCDGDEPNQGTSHTMKLVYIMSFGM